jgi:hypothetical protein
LSESDVRDNAVMRFLTRTALLAVLLTVVANVAALPILIFAMGLTRGQLFSYELLAVPYSVMAVWAALVILQMVEQIRGKK